MKLRRITRDLGLAMVGLLVFFWTALPIYHMVVMAITPNEVVNGDIWPEQPTIENFRIVFTQDHFYLENFWVQLGNSVIIALTTVVLVLLIATTASFAIVRLRPRWGQWVSNMALTTYIIPAAFLVIPFYQIMTNYGLKDNLWSLIFAMITFATPYAIWVLNQYAETLPHELDEAARIDGASVPQIYRLIYLPLIAPALVAVGVYALLMAWNEYLYAFMLLSDEERVTVPVAMGFFLGADDSPWNLLMATALVYAIPPVILYYAVRRYMVSGLTAGGVKG